jgi:hypothetical protein
MECRIIFHPWATVKMVKRATKTIAAGNEGIYLHSGYPLYVSRTAMLATSVLVRV